MATFEFDGEKYKNASRHQKEWGNKLISELKLSGNEIILDLGCGDGILTALLAERVPQGSVLGIDSSEGMVTTARELGRENLRFQLIDINHINFMNEFDLIFSNATLHWIKNHRKLLQNVYMGLKPGGIIRFNFAAHGNCSTFNSVVKEMMAHPGYSKHFVDFEWPWYMPRIDDYISLMKEFDFKDTRIWEENADRNFSVEEEMVKWIDQPSLVPFLSHIDGEDKQRFRDDVVRMMTMLTKREDGKHFEAFRRINVYAMK